jgi:hypothetical protein
MDLRSDAEFETSHIPGAENIKLDQIFDEVSASGDRLAVIIAPEPMGSFIAGRLRDRQNFVFMSHCHRWSELKNPRAREGLQATIGSFQELEGGRYEKRYNISSTF